MILLESATSGLTGQRLGSTVWGQQFLGWRFNVTAPSMVKRVGGHIGANFVGTGLFAAIVRLVPPNFLPTFAPHQIDSSPETMAHIILVPQSLSSDVLASFSSPVLLQPGNYGLVFGGADSAVQTSPYYPFNATGTGFMPNNNSDLPGSSYFVGDVGQWSNGGAIVGLRFVVELEPVVLGDQCAPKAPSNVRVS